MKNVSNYSNRNKCYFKLNYKKRLKKRLINNINNNNNKYFVWDFIV